MRFSTCDDSRKPVSIKLCDDDSTMPFILTIVSCDGSAGRAMREARLQIATVILMSSRLRLNASERLSASG